MSILAIDPGENVGYAGFTAAGECVWSSSIDSDSFFDKLVDWVPSYRAVVVEDYRLQRGKQLAQTGSRFEASQVIGAMRLYARIHDIPFITQSPQILRITGMNMHIPLPLGHIPDALAAKLHGFRYFIENGMTTASLREINGIR